MKACKHVWDTLTRVWTKDGQRAIPCKKCPELDVIGTISIKKENKDNGKANL